MRRASRGARIGQPSRRNDGTSSASSAARSRLRGTDLRLGARAAAAALAAEAGRDHRDAHLVAHRLVDDRAEDDVRVLVGRARHDLGRLVHLEQADVGAAGDVEEDPGRAFDRRLEQRRRDGGARRLGRAVLAAREPMPMSAEPASRMIVRTSAKSRLTRPGTVMRSVMPWTPWRRTSSAMRKASTTDVCCSTTWRSRSFSITISVSTRSRRLWMPCSACCARFRPSNANGFVTTPTVSAPSSRPSSRGSARRRCRCRRPRRR